MKFSVITVTFNAGETLAGTIRSLSMQTCKDYEWIVFDGASSDGTVALAQTCTIANKRIYSERDCGIYDAMNKALRTARGEWVYFLNSGDVFASSDVLACVAGFLDEHPRVELVYGDMHYVEGGRERLVRSSHVGRRFLAFESLNHQAVFGRRTLFEQLGAFELGFRTSADYDWLLRVFRARAQTLYLPKVIAKFQTGGAHVKDRAALNAERAEIRLQYVSPTVLMIGAFIARIRRRYRIFRGHA